MHSQSLPSCKLLFFFKHRTAYELLISDWSSDVCSSDLLDRREVAPGQITGVDQPGGGDDRGAMLVVMEHRNVHAVLQRGFDAEAIGRGDNLQVYDAKARREPLHGLAERLRRFGVDLERDGVKDRKIVVKGKRG